MAETARDIIKDAMKVAGVLTKTQEPSADEAADGLRFLNNMIDSWSNDSSLIYSRSLESFTLTANQQNYTLGPGGNFNTERPVKIMWAYVRVGGIDYTLDIVEDESFATIIWKNQGSIPQFLNYTNGYPQGTIKLWPFPASGYQLFLLMEKALPEFSSLNTEVALPPGWKRALTYNLAIEIAPQYGQELSATAVDIAGKSIGDIRTAVMQARSMDYLGGLAGQGNIFNGWYFNR